MITMQPFLHDGDQQISRYGYRYLRLHRVLAGAKEHLDAQVLLDPFAEQRHLPTLAIKITDQLGFKTTLLVRNTKRFPLSSLTTKA